MDIHDKLQHSRLPRGTSVMAKYRFSGIIDGYTQDGKHIVLFDVPVKFDSIGKVIYRACFDRCDLVDMKSHRGCDSFQQEVERNHNAT